MLNALFLLLRLEAIFCVLFGLWSHSGTLIIAGAICWLVQPLLGKQIREV